MNSAAFAVAATEGSTVISQVTNLVPTFTPANFTATVIAAVEATSRGYNNNCNRNRNHNHNNDNIILAEYGYCWIHRRDPQRGAKPHNSATYRNQC